MPQCGDGGSTSTKAASSASARIALSRGVFGSRPAGTTRPLSQSKASMSLKRWLPHRKTPSVLDGDRSVRYPQTSAAVSTMRRSFATSSSYVSTLPSTVEEKPHCGDRQSCSSGTNFAASSIRRLRLSFDLQRAALGGDQTEHDVLVLGARSGAVRNLQSARRRTRGRSRRRRARRRAPRRRSRSRPQPPTTNGSYRGTCAS